MIRFDNRNGQDPRKQDPLSHERLQQQVAEHDYEVHIEPKPPEAPHGSTSAPEESDACTRVSIEIKIASPEHAAFCADLVAALQKLVSDGQEASASILQYDDLTLDRLKRSVARDGHELRLTAREFGLCEYFMMRPDRVLTCENILEHVWGLNHGLDDPNIVQVYVSRLRKKLDNGFRRTLLHTVVGFGYMLSKEPPAAAA